jgi:hypothetical protein
MLLSYGTYSEKYLIPIQILKNYHATFYHHSTPCTALLTLRHVFNLCLSIQIILCRSRTHLYWLTQPHGIIMTDRLSLSLSLTFTVNSPSKG